MEKRLSVFAPIVVLILISVIGFGLAYNSTVSVESDVIGSYCSIVGDVNGSPVNSVSIIVDNSGDSPIYNLGFTSTSGETQETLSLHYYHSMGTSLVLSMTFIMSGLDSENVVIVCYGENGMVGSTILSGIEEKTGIISGILLEFETGMKSDNSDYHFEIKGINSVDNLSIQMSLSIHPLGVSS